MELSKLSIIIPRENENKIQNNKNKVKYSFIATNKGWESVFFEDMSKEKILEKVIDLLYDAKDNLEFAIERRNFSRRVEKKYLSISDTVILGLNLLPYVNRESYTDTEHQLLNNIAKIQREVLNLYNSYHTLKKVWFN